jgi:hypothetical protein
VLAETVIAAEVTDVRFGAVKTSVCAPLPVIARVLNVAVPFAFVVAVVVPLNVPPPLAIAAVTTTPDWLTGELLTSCNCTTGCCVKALPLVALADGCVVIASFVATGGSVTVMVADVTDVRFGAVNTSACAPLPVIARFVNVATPLAFVVAVVVPLNVPPPLAIAAVTTTPD